MPDFPVQVESETVRQQTSQICCCNIMVSVVQLVGKCALDPVLAVAGIGSGCPGNKVEISANLG